MVAPAPAPPASSSAAAAAAAAAVTAAIAGSRSARTCASAARHPTHLLSRVAAGLPLRVPAVPVAGRAHARARCARRAGGGQGAPSPAFARGSARRGARNGPPARRSLRRCGVERPPQGVERPPAAAGRAAASGGTDGSDLASRAAARRGGARRPVSVVALAARVPGAVPPPVAQRHETAGADERSARRPPFMEPVCHRNGGCCATHRRWDGTTVPEPTFRAGGRAVGMF